MLDKGVEADAVSYNTVINACALQAEPGRGPQLEPAAGDAALGSSLGHGHGSAAERGPRARQRVADQSSC